MLFVPIASSHPLKLGLRGKQHSHHRDRNGASMPQTSEVQCRAVCVRSITQSCTHTAQSLDGHSQRKAASLPQTRMKMTCPPDDGLDVAEQHIHPGGGPSDCHAHQRRWRNSRQQTVCPHQQQMCQLLWSWSIGYHGQLCTGNT